MEKREAVALMRQSPVALGKICTPGAFSVKSPPFHYEMADVFLDKSIRKVNVIAPRGHAKSTMWACVFVLHHILFDSGPKLVLLSSRTEGHAVKLLDTIKNVLDYSMPFRGFFGYWGEHSAQVWTRTEVVLKDGTMITCRGTGQQVVGLKHHDQRPTLVILDDPEDMANTKTVDAMEVNLKWLLQSLVPGLDPLRGRIAVIGTPQHQRSMIMVLSEMDGWKTLRYKALQEDGSALWPEWWSVERLLEEKASLESVHRVSSWYREFQCVVIADETALFKEEYFQYYEGFIQHDERGEAYLHREGEEPLPVNIFIGIDPASSTSQSADYTVIMPVAEDAEGNFYTLEYVRARMTPSQTIEKIVGEFHKWKAKKVSIETTGAQETFRDILRNLEGEYIPGLATKHNPRDKKEKRYIEVLEPYFFKRKVFMKRSQTALLEELLAFGPTAKHDDLIDGLYYAIKGAYRPSHGAVAEGTKGKRSRSFLSRTNSWKLA